MGLQGGKSNSHRQGESLGSQLTELLRFPMNFIALSTNGEQKGEREERKWRYLFRRTEQL